MSPLYQKRAHRRTTFLSFILVFWMTSLLVRLIQLQVFEHPRLKADVLGQTQDRVKILPKRGTIYDRSGNILARSIPRKSVYCISSPREPYSLQLEKIYKLRQVLGLSDNDIRKIKDRLKMKSIFIWVKRKIDPDREDIVEKLLPDGFYFIEENKRFYPHHQLAAHLLGRIGIDDTGFSGVEYKYNSYLQGEEGEYLILRDAKKRKFHRETLNEPKPGKNIYLTIDETLQYLTEKELARAVRETGANWGTVIVSRPSTGEILAMANYPTYDLNNPPNNPVLLERNKAIHSLSDPGSTFKIVTFASALESGRISPRSTFDCSKGYIPVGSKLVRDHQQFNILTFPEVIVHSSNVGTIQIIRRLDEDALYKTIKDFGFGQATGIELPAEEAGILHPLKHWTRSAADFLSIGYGISSTPIQMLQAINIIANKGLAVHLRIVKKVLDFAEESASGHLQPERIISEKTALTLTSWLERVVQEGTGVTARINSYRVAGKTGTAQKLNSLNNGYSSTAHIASFAGFVPADNPVLSMIVVLDEPKNRYYGGDVAAPLFREIASRALRYLEIPQQKNYLKTIRAANPWRSTGQ